LRKKAILAYVKALSWHMPGGIENNPPPPTPKKTSVRTLMSQTRCEVEHFLNKIIKFSSIIN
jgi:hypothetical protein